MSFGSLVAGVCFVPAVFLWRPVAIWGPKMRLWMTSVSGEPKSLPGCASAVHAHQWLSVAQIHVFSHALVFASRGLGKNPLGNISKTYAIMLSVFVA